MTKIRTPQPLVTAPPADVLLLGTYHMANPGRDVIRFVADDVLSDHRQAELADLVASLAEFRPTKVCVEVTPESQRELDDAFERFLSGALEQRRDEVAQVAFPLARSAGLSTVHGINDTSQMRWDGLEAFLEEHPEEQRRFHEFLIRSQEAADERSRRLATSSIRDFLRERNHPESLRSDAAFYVDAAGLGGVSEHRGAEMLTSWYARNIRIFSNLCGVTETDDRIFILIGAGHVSILRKLIGLSSRHRLVDVASYL
ncbi:MAG: DUF5694 domain-containing protein [Candidatus Eisenbacteria bacterium]